MDRSPRALLRTIGAMFWFTDSGRVSLFYRSYEDQSIDYKVGRAMFETSTIPDQWLVCNRQEDGLTADSDALVIHTDDLIQDDLNSWYIPVCDLTRRCLAASRLP